MRDLWKVISVGLVGALATGCTSASSQPSRVDDITDVVATTPMIADMTRQVAGEHARVTQLIPNGADPHTYEPTLRTVRDIANSDVALMNGLLLEPQALTRTVVETVPDTTPVIEVADSLSQYGGELIALVENVALDTVWLGMRVQGYGQQHGGSSASETLLNVTDVQGPGDASAFVTTTFGQPEVYFNSRDGIDEADSAVLPTNAHTHVSWSFSQPGTYEIDFQAQLRPQAGEEGNEVDIAEATVTIAVGINPHQEPALQHKEIVDGGHIDVTVDLDSEEVLLVGDAPEDSEDPNETRYRYDPADTVLTVPNSTLKEIPGEPTYRFLGTPGDQTYLLPQAVLGKHVHGEVDPHVWHDVNNARAMVMVIRDALIEADPANGWAYLSNADAYLEQLDQADEYMAASVESIPPANRSLVTTHHGYAYLDEAYGLSVAGFVTPNPDIEPSPQDMITLTQTLENLNVPAVFVEPQLAMRGNELTETAKRLDLEVCPIYGDTFDPATDDAVVTSYLDMVYTNADNLASCLGGSDAGVDALERN